MPRSRRISDARPPGRLRRIVFAQPPPAERTFLADALRQETVGGVLIFVAAAVALFWANSPWQETYAGLRDVRLGPLTLEKWASEGLLTIFFFVAGLELKRELVVGSLSRIADALVPVTAAIGGMVLPALIYLAISLPGGHPEGWAVPTATDIAFALALLAVAASAVPSSLRAFLLTLAVVDDLGAILIIALVFTGDLHPLSLGVAGLLLLVYAGLQRARVHSPLLYAPLAVAAWWFVHEAGIHATVAGVALGMLTRVRPDPSEDHSPAERLEHQLRPLSAGVAVPLFALTAAGVTLEGGVAALVHPIAIGVIVGLVLGKFAGVLLGAYVVTRLTRAELALDLTWRDIAAVSVLSGVGLTVSLLIAELAFTGEESEIAKAGVLAGSLLAGATAALLLRGRQRAHVGAGAAAG